MFKLSFFIWATNVSIKKVLVPSSAFLLLYATTGFALAGRSGTVRNPTFLTNLWLPLDGFACHHGACARMARSAARLALSQQSGPGGSAVGIADRIPWW